MPALDASSAHEILESAHKASILVPVEEQARYVQERLGSRLAAASLGLKDTRTLSSWARGGPVRSDDGAHRLQVLFRVTKVLDDAFGPAVAAAFLRGSNPSLGGQAPMIELADIAPDKSEERLLSAVEAILIS